MSRLERYPWMFFHVLYVHPCLMHAHVLLCSIIPNMISRVQKMHSTCLLTCFKDGNRSSFPILRYLLYFNWNCWSEWSKLYFWTRIRFLKKARICQTIQDKEALPTSTQQPSSGSPPASSGRPGSGRRPGSARSDDSVNAKNKTDSIMTKEVVNFFSAFWW